MQLIDGKNVYSVTEVNSFARKTLEQISFWVEGELSSFKGYNKRYRYIYFDLKDPQTDFKLPCILEPEAFLEQNYQYEDGMKVLALGSLTLWEKEARLQMHILKIQEYGEGFLLAELEKLKKKLQKMGYFDKKNKKYLPRYPEHVAVISSKISDAWYDFKKHSQARFPFLAITLFDVKVQGRQSSRQIEAAIKKADSMKFDVIVLVRGGGSAEDLAAFNDEGLANRLFKTKTPLIVGVGHEKDITIASLVADVAASTPTDAAKILTENYIILDQKLLDLNSNLNRIMKNIIWNKSQDLDNIYQRLINTRDKFIYLPKNLDFHKKSILLGAKKILDDNNSRLALQKLALLSSWKNKRDKNKSLLSSYYHKLQLVSPKNILKRGYSITTNAAKEVIKDSSLIDIGQKLEVKLFRGVLSTKVYKKG